MKLENQLIDKMYNYVDLVIEEARQQAKNATKLQEKIDSYRVVKELEKARSNLRLSRFQFEDAVEEVFNDRASFVQTLNV